MKKIHFLFLSGIAFLFLGFSISKIALEGPSNVAFQRTWSYVSETSAVIYWQLEDISLSANSFVEYGKSESLGKQTPATKRPRWAHWHRLNELDPGATYYYRMVSVDPINNKRTNSEIYKIETEKKKDAIRIPVDMTGSMPYILDQKDAYYILTEDITAEGTAIEIAAEGITLDLDGHTVVFGENSSEQVYGVRFADPGNTRLCNGHILQGKKSRDYSAAVVSLDRPVPTEIFGISTDVHLPNAFPLLMTHANTANIHHNNIYSRVTEIECRHYPGNALMRIYTYGGDIHIHDNLVTEGCHWGINVRIKSRTAKNIEIDNNDIQHHQQYVNGYALAPSEGALVHHNKITSSGRGVHLKGDATLFYNNYIDTKGHQQLSDYPARTRPFQHRLIELHGIKFEGRSAKNCKVYNNFVRITQYLPVDSGGVGALEDKMENGVYIRSTASAIEKDRLVDTTQAWEKDRWRYYFLKYHPDLPPAKITGNDANTLYADFKEVSPGEYTIYMKWEYVPPTPLNLACYDPNGMNEIYDNTFIGITNYKEVWHGDYGDTGDWATAIMLIAMDKGPADPGKYAAYVHDNQFYSNDLFFNSGWKVNMTIRLENNIFTLLKEPFAIERPNRIFDVGEAFEKEVRASNNTFNEGTEEEKFATCMVQFKPFEANPVFEGTGKGTWDKQIRERGFILFEEGIYKMWYSGYKGVDSEPKYLGYATSKDGISWSRHSENPIFNEKWTEDMFVIKEDGTYFMYAEGENDVAHLLTSPDGISWQEQGDLVILNTNGEPIPPPYGTPVVWIENEKWYLFYERNDNGIWLATSEDQINWRNVQDEAVINKGPGAYDEGAVAANQVVRYNDKYYIYYHGSSNPDWADPNANALWTSNVAVSTDLVHWEKYSRNPIVEGDHSSPILVFDGEKQRLYTMHDKVWLYFSE